MIARVSSVLARVLVLLVVFGAILVAGIWLGGHPHNLPDPVRDRLVEDSGAQRFNEALGVVESTFYRKVPQSTLVSNAISGMVKDLDDPYSKYFPPKEYEEFQENQAQQFSGIGVGVGPNDLGLQVLRTYPDSPAREAGLKTGDVIVSADGKPLKGLKLEQAVALVKGPEGSKVVLGIRRDGKTRKVTVARREVIVPSVGSRIRTYNGRRYQQIAIGGFTQSDVTEQVIKEIENGKKKGAKGVVLDLRSNPGGLVSQAQGVTSQFLPKGKVVVSTRGRSVPSVTLKTIGGAVAPDTPLVVLVDKNSASASEIVAGALQDHKRAKLVGIRTYGKGVFQQLIELGDGGALDLTAGQYYTPNGRNLGAGGSKKGEGLAPDVKVPGDSNTAAWRERSLETALKTLDAEAR